MLLELCRFYNHIFLLCLLHFLPFLTLLLSLRCSFLIIPLISCPTPHFLICRFCVSISVFCLVSSLCFSVFYIPPYLLCECIYSLPTYFLSTCLYLFMSLFSYFCISDSPGLSLQVSFFLPQFLAMRANNRTGCHFRKFTYKGCI